MRISCDLGWNGRYGGAIKDWVVIALSREIRWLEILIFLSISMNIGGNKK